jgi:hypothetical protein
MTTGSTGTGRRTLLQRGLALLAGGAAIAGGTRWAAAASLPPALSTSLIVYARRRPIAGIPGTAGPQLAADGRVVASGDLLDAPDGQSIGTFYTNTFSVASPFGGQAASASSLEFHVLQMKDGTLFSLGSGGDENATGKPLAIVGGTSRFAGKSGACLERAVAGVYAGDDIREITVTFAG